MNREQIIDLIDRKIDFQELKKAGKALEKHYEVRYNKMDAEDVKICLSNGHPVAIHGKLIIGYEPMRKAFETADTDFLQIERPIDAVEVCAALPEPEHFAIIGRNEWSTGLDQFYNIIGNLRLGEIYLPKHSAIFNFLNPTDQTKKEKIQSVLNGVQINVYEPENYVDNCLHEIGHLFWRTCTRFEEKMQFKELHKYLKQSCIYEYSWERSDAEEVFCTVYKWYMKSVLINKSFYNILEYEEPQGLKILQQVFSRIAKDRIISDVWEMSEKDVIEYLNPPFDKTSGKYIRKSGIFNQIKDIELPEHVLNQIQSVQDGVPYIGLGKALVPVQGDMIDFVKARDLSKLTRKTITDKKGHVRTVWVKTGKEEKKESKGSQIDTPEFKKWFGDSKVVDSQGKPLVVYHGTDKDFNEFDINKSGESSDTGMWGKGFYFSDNPDYASHYAKKGKGNVKPVYISIKNPYIIKLKSDIPKIDVPNETIEDMKNADKNYSRLFTEYMVKKGYDGVIVKLDNDKEIIAFSPNQIKSATGNKGTFDPNSADMTKAVNTDKEQIFLDMDGCVTNFAEAYKQAFDRDCFTDDSFTVTQMCLTQPRFFRTIPVLEKGKELYNRLVKKYDVIFLTTPMADMEYCKADKLAWLKENICENPTVIFSDSKSDYAHSEKDILIDDYDKNLIEFSRKGGTAIDFRKHSNDEIMAKIAETLNPQLIVRAVKQQLKDMQVDTAPSEKQKEIGNYAKGKIIFKQIPVMIENPKGSMRSGIGQNGVKWLSKLHSHYGYISGTVGNDFDPIDVFIGDDLSSSKVFVINQGFNGLFDEHKILLGYSDINSAREAFLKCYEKGWSKNIMSIGITNTKKLREWIKDGVKTEPFVGDK